jgi:hypothetical protein
MPEDLGDFRDRRTMADHPGGQTMPKKVSHATRSWAHASASEGEPHNVVDRARPGQSNARRDQAEKDPAWDTCPTVLTEVERDGFANIGEKRHMIQARTLAAHDDFTRAPTNIAELKRHDFPSPQAEPRQQEQDRVVAAPSWGWSACDG